MVDMDHKKLEAVLEEIAKQQGHGLNGQDRLMIRTRVGIALAAKERHRKRMTTPEYQWKKPERPR